MKINSKLTTALIALGVVSSASATNFVYLTGSTAFRAVVQNALASNAGPGAGGVFDAGSVNSIATWGNAASSKALYSLFHGTINSVETYVDCFWTGSEAGIAAVAGNNNLMLNDGAPLAGVPATFLVPSTVNNPNGNNAGLPSPTSTPPTLNNAPTQPDLAFADTSQAVSLTPANLFPTTSYGICAIVPFVWVKGAVNKNDAAWARLTNMQSYQANQLFANGTRTADFFNSAVVGGANDFDHTVYLFGRNKGSGTRANYLLAAGYPVGTPVIQWSANSAAGINPSTGLPGVYYVGAGAYLMAAMPHQPGDTDDSNNGYESGGDVNKALNQANAPVTGYIGPNGDHNSALTVGFLGIPDSGAPANGVLPANFLTYNGTVESDGAIESGSYLPWGHEHVYGPAVSSNPPGPALVPLLFESIKFQLANNDTVPLAPYEGVGWNVAVDPATLHSPGIYGFYMVADRGITAADGGFPVTGDAFGLYTQYNVGGQ